MMGRVRGALFGAAMVWVQASGRASGAPVPDARSVDPAAPHALGRVSTAGPSATGPSLLLSGGYGYTESVLGIADAHHRLAGTLAVEERPVPWLGLTLRLDGRYDAHLAPGQPTDSGMVGDPRVYARVDRAWAGGLRLGARAGLWLPGRNAPSLDTGALSPELVGLVSYAPDSSPIAVTANAGYRLDRSAHAAPDTARLNAGDRLALGVSEFDAALVGVAATLGRGPAQGFVEASADVLIGSGAPPVRSSPIFVGAGGRFALGRNVRLEGLLEVSPSRRPDVGPTAPLVPVPPRFAAWVGLAIRFDAAPPAPLAEPAPRPTPAPPPAATAPVPKPAPEPEAPEPPDEPVARPPQGQIRGLVRSLRGVAVAADVVIEPDGAAGEAQPLRAEDGRFQIDVMPGRYRVTITAAGYRSQTRKVEIEENGVTVLNVDLRKDR
jgi:hypothetical protein